MHEVHQLSKRYGPFLVPRDVSFAVRRGEVLGYLGPNGSGKSTTVKMLTGLLEPTRRRCASGSRWSPGMLTVLAWDALLVDRRDAPIHGTLPVAWRTILAAKGVTLVVFWIVTTVAVDIVSAVVFARRASRWLAGARRDLDGIGGPCATPRPASEAASPAP